MPLFILLGLSGAAQLPQTSGTRAASVPPGAPAVGAEAKIGALGALQGISLRDALWIIVHDECVPAYLHSHDPKPCVLVDLRAGIQNGFVILKDIRGATQFFLIPTARISGIESPVILAPDAPNYFAHAWEARANIEEAMHRRLPRDAIGLAINSAASRSQDQLHIHVDCIRPDVQEALREHESSIGNQWAPLDVLFSEHRYMAMWVQGERLGSNNPFRLLAEELPGRVKNMGDQTVVTVGSSRANGTLGFVILEDQVDRSSNDLANGEELLDHACRIAATSKQKE